MLRRHHAGFDRANPPQCGPVVEMISRVCGRLMPTFLITRRKTARGKSLVARAIHALSPRANRTMITVNMGRPVRNTIRERTVRTRQRRVFYLTQKTDRAGRFELADESTPVHGRDRKYPRLPQQGKTLCGSSKTGDFERVGSSKNTSR